MSLCGCSKDCYWSASPTERFKYRKDADHDLRGGQEGYPGEGCWDTVAFLNRPSDVPPPDRARLRGIGMSD